MKKPYNRLRLNMQVIESDFVAEINLVDKDLKDQPERKDLLETKKDLKRNLLRLRVLMEKI